MPRSLVAAIAATVCAACFFVFAYYATMWTLIHAMHGFPALFGFLSLVFGAIYVSLVREYQGEKRVNGVSSEYTSSVQFSIYTTVLSFILFLVEINLPYKSIRILLGSFALALILLSQIQTVYNWIVARFKAGA
jgi:hypothetical protein